MHIDRGEAPTHDCIVIFYVAPEVRGTSGVKTGRHVVAVANVASIGVDAAVEEPHAFTARPLLPFTLQNPDAVQTALNERLLAAPCGDRTPMDKAANETLPHTR